MTPLAKRALIAIAIVVGALTALGTVLWIVAIAQPAPQIAPARVVSSRFVDGRLVLTLDLAGGDAMDRLGAATQAIGLAMATGRSPVPGRIALVELDSASPSLRLIFDAGILTAGAASSQTPDHLLGLAGAGSRWPDPRSAYAYCGRMETMRGDFCTHVAAGK